MLKYILSLLVAFTVVFSLSGNASAGTSLSEEQKKEVNKMIFEYIRNNPERIIESLNLYQQKKEEEARKKAEENVKKYSEVVKKDTSLPFAGNPDGDVVIVEFFDYNCGYCKKALDEIKSIIKEDKNIKVVFREMPILSPSSTEAAKWALAAQKQGKYFEYHAALMEHRGAKDTPTLKNLAEEVGLDVKKLEKDKNSAEISIALERSLSAAQKLEINGTPAFMIGDKMARGYIPLDEMKKMIAEIRKTSATEKGGKESKK